MHSSKQRWQILPEAPSEHFQRFSDQPHFIAQIFYNRGLTSRADAEAFLSPESQDEHDPFLMKGMAEAVGRIGRAIANSEPIVVYGDFDADGITSTAVLVETIASLGGVVQPYIPHRTEEGYGLNATAVQALGQKGTRLVITADCGISSVEEIGYAAALGMDVIVTDHHHLPPELPEALAIVSPRQSDCPYPFKDLAGVGVAYKVASALLTILRPDCPPDREAVLDLVAIGTVADMAPLRGENRLLVRNGLAALEVTRRPGLQAMMSRSGITSVSASAIGFSLGPRLNASGRLDSAMLSYRLLTTSDEKEAMRLADRLEAANCERQNLTIKLQAEARAKITERDSGRSLIIVAGEQFKAGVVGLVAGRLSEEFYRPAIVVEIGPATSRGSARSIPEFNIVGALDSCRDLLVRYGGHAQAAGFTVENSRYAELIDRLHTIADAELHDCVLEPALHIDAEMALDRVTWPTLEVLSKLAPFGYANPTPVLMARGVQPGDRPRIVGRDHLKFRAFAGRSGLGVDAIAFRQGDIINELGEHRLWDIAYCLESNQWGDYPPVLQLNVKGMRPSQSAETL